MQRLDVTEDHERLVRRRADILARSHLHLEHLPCHERPHDQSIQFDLGLGHVCLCLRDRLTDDIAVILPRTGLEQIEVGLRLVERRLGTRQRLASRDQFLFGSDLAGKCLLGASERVGLADHRRPRLVDLGQDDRNLLLAGLGLEPDQFALGLGDHRPLHRQFALQLPVIEPEERLARLHLVANLHE